MPGRRHEAVISGTTSALMAVIPALLLHVTFAAGYPDVLTQPVPTFWMISSLDMPVLTVAYLCVLFGSLFDVGIGFIQSINERIDGWSIEQRGKPIAKSTRIWVALLSVLISGFISLVGIERLIASGYGTMAYGFLLLYVTPLLTVGLYRLSQRA